MDIFVDTEVAQFIRSKMHVNALKKLGIETVYELMTYYLIRVLEPAIKVKSIADMKKYTSEQKCIFEAMIVSKTVIPMKANRGKRLELQDTKGRSIKAVFFAKNNSYFRWLYSKWAVGERVVVVGTPQVRDSYQLAHPEIYMFKRSTGADAVCNRYLRPQTLYAASSKISSERISELIRTVAQKLEGLNAVKTDDPWARETASTHIFPDVLPQDQMKFPSRWAALKAIHMPRNLQEYESARKQMKLEEAYILQSILLMNKSAADKRCAAVPCARVDGGLLDK